LVLDRAPGGAGGPELRDDVRPIGRSVRAARRVARWSISSRSWQNTAWRRRGLPAHAEVTSDPSSGSARPDTGTNSPQRRAASGFARPVGRSRQVRQPFLAASPRSEQDRPVVANADFRGATVLLDASAPGATGGCCVAVPSSARERPLSRDSAWPEGLDSTGGDSRRSWRCRRDCPGGSTSATCSVTSRSLRRCRSRRLSRST
jgi:hypothetical protein